MTGPLLEVRYLCENVQDLILVPEGSHPVGAGLSGKLQYSDHAANPHRLPRDGETLEAIRAKLEGPAAPTMDANQSAMAWHLILARPSLVVPLERPDIGELLHQDIVVPTVAADSLRQIGLVSVVKQDGQAEDRLHPVAGVIRLVTASDTGRESSPSHAWLLDSWQCSINGLARELEKLWRMAKPAIQQASKERRATLLIADDESYSSVQIEKMRAACSIFGFHLSTHRQAAVAFMRARQTLRDSPPGLLLRSGLDPTGHLETLTEEYLTANPIGHVIRLSDGDEGWLPDLREGLAQAIGVTPGLMPTFLAEDVDDTADSGSHAAGLRALVDRFPDHVKRARHAAYGHFVRTPDGKWYSHDRAKHGGSQFKCHLERDNALHWESDLDGELQVIDKHKSPTGRVIPMSELNFAE